MRSLSPHFGTSIFYLRSMIITHYCRSFEDALKKAKQVAKQPGYDYWGKTLLDSTLKCNALKRDSITNCHNQKSDRGWDTSI